MLLALALAVVAGGYARKLVAIAAGYKAKVLCSGVFISQRDPDALVQEDLRVEDLARFAWIVAKADLQRREATAGWLGWVQRKAVFTPGFGCHLCPDGFGEDTRLVTPAVLASVCEPRQATRQLPEARQISLEPVLDWAFAEADGGPQRRTRAVVVLHQGVVIAERYAPGFHRDMPLTGWSMAKSFINAWVGLLVGQGVLDLDAPAPVPEWQGQGDPRRAITLRHLLEMRSGLAFQEKSSNPLSDVTQMLLLAPDAAAYAARQPLRHPVGTTFNYASGTTNIISRLLRHALGDEAYWRFPKENLFEPLGMDSAILERDASGTFVGSSFLYATARDWARFGQLYLQDGVWQGRRILPERWVAYTASPTVCGQQYGAHFWRETHPVKAGGDAARPLPADAFHAIGYEGQYLSIIPSRQLAVVRLGLTRRSSLWRQDALLGLILDRLAAADA